MIENWLTFANIHGMDTSEARAELAELLSKAAWYDRVHEPREIPWDSMTDEERREEFRISTHLTAEFSDAAEIMPKKLAELRKDRERLEWRNDHPEYIIYTIYDFEANAFLWKYRTYKIKSPVNYSMANEAIDAAMKEAGS